MGVLSAFFTTHLIAIYFVYGLVFFVMDAVICSSPPRSATSLVLSPPACW